MKDYRLSEIKAICEKNKGDCKHCELMMPIVNKGGFMNYDTITYFCPTHIEPMFWNIDGKNPPKIEEVLKGEEEDDETRDN